MTKLSKEPAKWKNYDLSSLPNLLRHDTWTWQFGLSLLCGIDPKNSEPFSECAYYKVPYDEIGMFAAQTGADTFDNTYWKIQLLADSPNTGRRTWYESFDAYQAACVDWDTTHDQFLPGSKTYTPLDEIDKNHMAAAKTLADISEIFLSHPDHDPSFAESPNYFIEWAKAKNIENPWLEWARARGFWKGPAHASDRDLTDLDKRERDTLDTIVGALLHALEIDPNGHGVIKQVVGLTEDYGAPIGKSAVSNILRRIRSAKESVQTRKRR